MRCIGQMREVFGVRPLWPAEEVNGRKETDMRVLLCVLLVVLTLGVLEGCTWPSGAPVSAALIFEQKGPVAGFENGVGANKVGRAKAEGVIFVGYGDASITAAKLDGQIQKIHHVDCERIMNIFGIYSRYETVVYGE